MGCRGKAPARSLRRSLKKGGVGVAFPPEFLQELEARSPIGDIAAGYVQLKRRGKNLVGLCPFHNEKTPSFNIYPDSNSYYCFGCSNGGGVIQFIMNIERLDFPEAVRWLAQRAGMALPEEGMDDSMSKLRMRILEINREAGRFFYKVLSTPEGKDGLDYFRRRGLDAATIRHFGLGYSPGGGFALTNHLRGKGYSVEELVQADVVRISKNGNPYDRYRGRVMFPIFDLRGNVVAFGGRILTDEKPKYINTTDTPVYHKSSGLFAMNFAKNEGSRRLILAEGYMDVIALHRAGFTNAIASLGTSLAEEQARIIRRYADEAIICYDSDEAGRRATQRAIPILRGTGLRVRVITVPGGKDPDEFMKLHGENGPARFKQLLEGGSTDIEYRLDTIRQKYDLEQSDGKVAYLREAVEQVLCKISSPVEQEVYANKLAQETGVDARRILSTCARQAARESKKNEKKIVREQQEIRTARSLVNPEKEKHLQAAMAEEHVIAFLFRNQDKAGALAGIIPPEKFVTEWNKRVYKRLLGKIQIGEVSLADFSQDLTRDEGAEISRILAESEEVPPGWKDMEAYARIIKSEKGLADPDWLKGATAEDIQRQMEELRARKS